MPNAATYLEATAQRSPDATAVIFRDRHFTYRQIDGWASQIAHGLTAEGFGPGSKIALCCSNRPGFLAAYFGILKIGGTVVNLLWSLKARDFTDLLLDSGAEAIFGFDAYGDTDVASEILEGMKGAPGCRKLWLIPADPEGPSPVRGHPAIGDLMRGRATRFESHPIPPEDTMLVVYTSGSTGRQKGIEISARAIGEILLLTVPLFEVEHCRVRLAMFTLECMMAQLFLLLQPVFLGHATVLLECEGADTMFDEEDPQQIWRSILDHGVTFVIAMPAVYRWLLDNSGNLAKQHVPLKLCITGGAPISDGWVEEFKERLGVQLHPGYGASETCAALAWTWPHEGYRAGSVGRPIPGIEMKIVDGNLRSLPAGEKGHLVLRTPALMTGYLNMPELTAQTIQDGWYHTRDLASFDADGYLRIYGRMDSRITRGVEHIEPALVESLLLTHPAVAQAVVVPVPHEKLGHEAKTFVTVRDDADITETELLDWLNRELPLGQCPGLLEIRDSLPMTNMGKVARHMLV
jgi:long-chain acyl-CoA synthetase